MKNETLEKVYKTVHNVGFTSDSKAAMDAAWNESDHPRAENGEFGSGGGSGKSAGANEPVSLSVSAPVPFVQSFAREYNTIESQEKYLKSVSSEKLQTGIRLIKEHRDKSAITQHVQKLLEKELNERSKGMR